MELSVSSCPVTTQEETNNVKADNEFFENMAKLKLVYLETTKQL